MTDSFRLLAKGAIFIFITALVSKLFNFILRVVIARQLGPAEYGLLSLGLAVFSIATIISLFGLDQSMERNINYYKKDEEKRGVIISGIKISFIIGIIVSILIFLFSELIATKVYHNIRLTEILQVFAIAIPIWSISEVILSSLKGLKKIEYYSYLKNITDPLLKVITTAILVYLGYKILAVTIGFLVTYVITLILSLLILNNKVLDLLGRRSELTKEIFSYSWPLLFAGIAALFVLWTDTLMIGYFLDEVKVGIYNAASPIAGLISIVGASTLGMYIPVITSHFTENATKKMKDTYVTITRWIFLISFPMLNILLLESKNILLVLFGAQYLEANLVLIIIGSTFFINGLLGPGRLILTSIGKTKYQMVNNIISLIANILLNIYLIPKYGITGAAIATGLSLIIRVLLTIIEVIYVLKIHPIDLKLIKLALVSTLTFLIIKSIGITASPLISIIITGILTAIIYSGLVLITKSIGEEEKEILKVIVKKIF